jgi:CBS domain-containing protein
VVTVKDILTQKGGAVFAIDQSASVLQAAQLMGQRRIGALVVMDAGQVTGIFTERDVLYRVVAAGLDPQQTTVHQVMSGEVICCRPDTALDEVHTIFKNRRIRHLPVVNDAGALQGLISIGDLNAYHANAQEIAIHYLHEYIYGRT